MKDNGVIEEVTEPTEWVVSPIIPVLKPSGDVCICVDLKKIRVLRENVMSFPLLMRSYTSYVALRCSPNWTQPLVSGRYRWIQKQPSWRRSSLLSGGTSWSIFLLESQVLLRFSREQWLNSWVALMAWSVTLMTYSYCVKLLPWKSMNCYWVMCSRDWKKLVFNSILRSVSTGSQRSPSWDISSARMVFVLMTRKSQQWSTWQSQQM